MYDIKENNFIFCSQYVPMNNRGIRDTNRILLDKIANNEEKEQSMEKLILNNRPLVWFVVKSLAKYHEWIDNELEDVIAQGYLYLCEIIYKKDYWSDAKFSRVNYFGVSLYYKLLGKLVDFIKKREGNSLTLEFSDKIELLVEDIPEIVDPLKMEIEYLFYNLRKFLTPREFKMIKYLYEIARDYGDIFAAEEILADRFNLTRSRINQIKRKIFRKIRCNYKSIFWDLFDD